MSENSATIESPIHTGIAPTCINNEYLQRILKSVLKDNSLRVSDYEIGPGSAIGDNYACQIFRIKINFTVKNQKESKSVIAKVLPNTDMTKHVMEKYNFFNIEVKMLSETLPLIYTEVSTKINSERFFPEFYKDDVENLLFFLEDLKTDGYVLADKKLSLDLDHVNLVIKALAKLHAGSYLLLKKNPDHKNNYLNGIYTKELFSFIQPMADGNGHYLCKFLNLWEISEEDKEIFRKFKFFDLMVDTFQRKESSFNVLIHGDCWDNNMMFKYDGGKVISVKLLDFQLPNYNSIGLDLNHFLFTSAKEYVKIQHLDDVLKTYYDTFVSVTGEIDGFSLDTVWKEFTERLGWGFSVGMLYRAGMLAEKPFDLQAYFEKRESENNMAIYQNKNFTSEATNLLPIFKKYGVFK